MFLKINHKKELFTNIATRNLIVTLEKVRIACIINTPNKNLFSTEVLIFQWQQEHKKLILTETIHKNALIYCILFNEVNMQTLPAYHLTTNYFTYIISHRYLTEIILIGTVQNRIIWWWIFAHPHLSF